MKFIDKILGELRLKLKFLNRKNSPSISLKGSSVKGDVFVGKKTVVKEVTQEKQEGTKKFEYLLENSNWHKKYIDHKQTWICNDDNMYQIEVGERERDFTEEWTQVYPDRYGSAAYPVYLKVRGVTIEQLLFISCDGGRIFVPLPERKVVEEKIILYYKTDSLEYKLAKIIGIFDDYRTIERVAEKSRIDIV